jgi:hypothetical protein
VARRQAVTADPGEQGGGEVGERGEREHRAAGGRVVEDLRAAEMDGTPRGGRRVDQVEEDERDADEQDARPGIPSCSLVAGAATAATSRLSRGATRTARGARVRAATIAGKLSGTKARPVASRPPAVHAAWNEGITGRPSRCSRATACRLLAASLAPRPRPWMATPAMKLGREPSPLTPAAMSTKPTAMTMRARRSVRGTVDAPGQVLGGHRAGARGQHGHEPDP